MRWVDEEESREKRCRVGKSSLLSVHGTYRRRDRKVGVCERHVRTVNLLRENHFLQHLHPIISVTFRNPQNPTVMPTSCGGCSDMQGWESKPDLKYFFLLRTTTSMSFSLCVYIMNTCLSVASFFFFFAPMSHIQIDLVVVNSKQLQQSEEALMMSPGIC